MKLQERIKADLDNTPYGTKPEKRELLKLLLAEIKLKKGNEPSEEDILAVIRKFKANALECNNLSELPILDAYLPTMMSPEAIKEYITLIINSRGLTTSKDLGIVMLHIKEGGLSDTIDKKLASQYAKELLTQ